MTPFRRIYIAGRYARRAEFKQYAERLITQGHAITSSWLEGPPNRTDAMDDLNHAKRRSVAKRDLEDVAKANLFIGFTQPRTDTEIGVTRGGRHFEAGYMYAQIEWARHLADHSNLPGGHSYLPRQVVIGPRENVFEFNIDQYPDFDTFYKVLEHEISRSLGEY